MSREVRLATIPDGLPRPEHFVVAEVPRPVPGDGDVLVRNRHFHVFAALSTLVGGRVKNTPIPPLRPGDTLPPRGGPGCSTTAGVVERRLAALDAEIDRLSRLRARLAERAAEEAPLDRMAEEMAEEAPVRRMAEEAR